MSPPARVLSGSHVTPCPAMLAVWLYNTHMDMLRVWAFQYPQRMLGRIEEPSSSPFSLCEPMAGYKEEMHATFRNTPAHKTSHRGCACPGTGSETG